MKEVVSQGRMKKVVIRYSFAEVTGDAAFQITSSFSNKFIMVLR